VQTLQAALHASTKVEGAWCQSRAFGGMVSEN
jgi:hypothetical protein